MGNRVIFWFKKLFLEAGRSLVQSLISAKYICQSIPEQVIGSDWLPVQNHQCVGTCVPTICSLQMSKWLKSLPSVWMCVRGLIEQLQSWSTLHNHAANTLHRCRLFSHITI